MKEMKRIFLSVFTMLPCFIFLSCGYSNLKLKKSPNENQTQESFKLTKGAVISWTLIQGSVMSTCMNCHVNHHKPELGDLGSVQIKLSKVLKAVKDNEMPPSKDGYSPLDNCQKEILETWIQNAAPEKTDIKVGSLSQCHSVPEDNAPPIMELPISKMPMNYNTLLTRILQPKCINCHNPDTDDLEAAGILFYPFSEISSREDLWEGPGANSKMVHVLTTEDEEKRMPRPIPPKPFEPLSKEEIDFIIQWIDAGKPQ